MHSQTVSISFHQILSPVQIGIACVTEKNISDEFRQ